MVNRTSIIFLILLVFSNTLLANPKTDKDIMDEARQAFAEENFEKSIQLYSGILATSDFWFDAIEERAWVYTRQKKYEKALADLKSITADVWNSQASPEAYMLSTFISLKLCDYKEVISKMSLFKKEMIKRIDALEKITDNAFPNEFEPYLDLIKNEKLSLFDLQKKSNLFPRYFYRQRRLIEALKQNQIHLAQQEMKKLASADLKDIQINLKKMKLIEIEMIQNVLAKNSNQKIKPGLEFAKINNNKQIVFPVTDEEVWTDEIGQFEVKASKCSL